MTNEKQIEKLSYEDGHVLEIFVDKLNELIDAVNALDTNLNVRVDSHWKYHRFLDRRIKKIEEKLGIKDE